MRVWLPAIRGRSGADVFTRRLAEALRRKGVAVEISWFPGVYEFFPPLLARVSPPRGTTVIHANSWSAFAFKRGSIPLVVTEQLGVLDPRAQAHKSLAQSIYHQTLLRTFMRASFRSASAITAVSDFTAQGLHRSLGLDSVRVIYNWVNTDVFHPETENRTISKRPFRLLFVGNPIRRKGFDLLAPIMRALGSDFALHFTGGLRNLSPDQIAPNMFSLGRIVDERELVDAYRRSDALLFPSRFEGLPHAVLEAMACSKPVIAANAASMTEVIETRTSGVLCPPDDVDAFIAACRKLAGDPETCERLGRGARTRAETVFSENVVVPEYLDLYRSLQ